MRTHAIRLIPLVVSAVVATAALVLAGWLLQLRALQSLGGSIDMNPVTALCFVASGVALVSSVAGGSRARRAAMVLAALVLLIGIARVAGYAIGIEIAIDRFLTNGSSNRMALNTAASFVFVAIALLVLNVETRGGHRPSEPAAAVSIVIALLALTGHAYHVPLLSRVAPEVIPMAEITAVAFLALASGILAHRPDRGWMAIVTGRHAGGVLARRLLTLAIGGPLVLGFLALQGQQLGAYTSPAGFAIFAVACMVVLAVVVLGTARSLGRADLALRTAHEAELRMRSQLEEVGKASLAISDAFANDDALQRIADRARAVVRAEIAAIGIGNDPAQPFSGFAQSGMSAGALAAIAARPHPVGLRGVVARDGVVTRIADVRTHPGFRGFPPNHPQIKSFLAVPVSYRGQGVGTIYLGNKLGAGEFTAEDEHAIVLLSSHVGIALENARLYREALLDRVRLATVLEQLPEGVVVRDAAGQVLVFNETARNLAKRLDGWLEVYRPNGNMLDRPEHPVWRALEYGEGVTGMEAELREDGARIPVLVNAAPIRHPDGAFAGAVAVFQDITPLKKLERMREEWNAVIAHDLRQPVNVIQLSATLLERRLEQGRERQTAARIIAAARNLDVMISDLLDLSRIEANRLDLRRKPVDIIDLVRELVERSMAMEPEHPIRLEANGVRSELSLDPARIEQVLGNLLSNAVKYGEPTSEVVVAVEGRHSEVEVAVTNRGPGIPVDELPRLFTRFYRARAARGGSVRGIGLGLYLCKGLIEAHGGVIRVDSVPGEATTFSFTLPRNAL